MIANLNYPILFYDRVRRNRLSKITILPYSELLLPCILIIIHHVVQYISCIMYHEHRKCIQLVKFDKWHLRISFDLEIAYWKSSVICFEERALCEKCNLFLISHFHFDLRAKGRIITRGE